MPELYSLARSYIWSCHLSLLGIPQARNAARGFGATNLAFTGDDKTANRKWLSSLRATMTAFDADAMQGPVRNLCPEDARLARDYLEGRTVTTVKKTEAEGVAFVEAVVASGSVIQVYEAGRWDALHAKYKTFRINHQKAYSLNGACTNQAESFLARLRRMVMGQHHHVSLQYLYQFANEAAWKEDHRRLSNGKLSYKKLALAHPVSRAWAGYWQWARQLDPSLRQQCIIWLHKLYACYTF